MTDSPDLLNAGLAVTTALLYVAAAARYLLHLDSKTARAPRRTVIFLALTAVGAHLITALLTVSDGAMNFGVYKVASLIFLTMALISIAILIVRPLHVLVIVTFPLAALAVLMNAFGPATGPGASNLSPGLLFHITLSLVAFGVLTLTSLQAGLVSLQAQRLRTHRTRGVIQILPPLDLMERMFFELLFAGVGLLTIAIVAGGFFVDDLFGQQLVHKTVLTVLGWAVFMITLLVHLKRGWRIGTAVTLVTIGYACLLLGFFGSKLVLELII